LDKSKSSSKRSQRILALDIGSKRIGIAVWNPEAALAVPLPILSRKTLKDDLRFLKAVVVTQKVEAFLIGIPWSLRGKMTPSTQNALFWLDEVKRNFSIPVYEFDESFSTRSAEEILKLTGQSSMKKRKMKKDSIAAALILEDFLNAMEG